jgi:membrane-associated PAP2 superfamily phosphatase
LPTGSPAWRRDLVVAVIGLLLLLAWDLSGLDLVSSHWYGNALGFPLQHAFLTSRVLHDGGRWLGFLGLALLVINVWGPWWPGLTRRQRVVGLMSTLLCVLTIPALKQISASSCPWDLAEFGGLAQYVSHWRFGVADGGPGRCFPSGHAVAAFGFFGAWFMLRETRPLAARTCLAIVIVAGLAFGWAQLARGAHYPSHTLWSAWWCWVLCALSAALAKGATAAPGR